jgi:hypothetical protein
MAMKINVDKICVMRIYRKAQHPYIEWHSAFKIFGITLSQEGFYYRLVTSERMGVEDIESNDELYVEDKTVYYKPHVEIEMANNRTITKWFDSEPELDVFLNSDELKQVKFKEI